MGSFKKREIYAGVATQMVLLSYLLLLTHIFGLKNNVTNSIHDGIFLLTIPWIFSLFVAVGAYYHAVNRSVPSLVALCVGAVAVMSILCFYWFVFIIWGAMSGLGILFTILLLTPDFLAGLTLRYAFTSETDKKDL